MKEFIELLANFKMRNLEDFERLIENMPFSQVLEVEITLRALHRHAQDKRKSMPGGGAA